MVPSSGSPNTESSSPEPSGGFSEYRVSRSWRDKEKHRGLRVQSIRDSSAVSGGGGGISFLVEETGVPGGNHRPTASVKINVSSEICL